MSTFHPAASSLANFNDTISTICMTPQANLLVFLASKLPYKCDVHGPHSQINTESHSQVMAFVQLSGSFHLRSILLICCHVHMLPKRHRGFWGVVNSCLSLLSAYLGIKHIFPCSFGNKCMCLLTHVYGT